MIIKDYIAQIIKKFQTRPLDMVVDTASTMTFDDLSALVSNLRPGMHADEIDQLAGKSNGMLCRKTLEYPCDNWTFEQKIPCRLRFNTDNFVTYVHYDDSLVKIKGLEPGASLDDVRKSFPDHSEVYTSDMMTEGGYVSLALYQDHDGYIVVCRFKDGEQLGLSFWDPVAMREREAEDRAYAEKKRKEKIEREAQIQANREKRRLHREWRRTADPKEVLQDWAKSHSAWGESSSNWERFANWLIEDSTPDERHMVIQGYNWDHGIDIPLWIIRQPDTHIATVIEIFWLSEPSYYVSALENDEPIEEYQETSRDLVVEIGAKLQGGFYKQTPGVVPIAYPGRKIMNWHDTNSGKLLVPLEVFNPIEGRSASSVNTSWTAPVPIDLLC